MAHAGEPKSATNPAANPLSDLPPSDTVRWVSSRKAAVVQAVQSGTITLADACDRYALSVEEFLSWKKALLRAGRSGLRAGYAQELRKASGQ